jgi:hypothetical protein
MPDLHGFFTPSSLLSSAHWGVEPFALHLVAHLSRYFAKAQVVSALVIEAQDDCWGCPRNGETAAQGSIWDRVYAFFMNFLSGLYKFSNVIVKLSANRKGLELEDHESSVV